MAKKIRSPYKYYVIQYESELREWYLNNHDVLHENDEDIHKWLLQLSLDEVESILQLHTENDPFDEYERYDD